MKRSDVDLLKRIAGSVRYKPGWSIEVRDMTNFMTQELAVRVVITYYVPEACATEINPNEFIKQKYSVFLQGEMAPVEFFGGSEERRWELWLFSVLLFLEQHECAEFFRVGDRRPFDPHAEHPDDAFGRLMPRPWSP